MKLTLFYFLLSLSLAGPAQTIVGKVLDTDTKKPLAGVKVFLSNRQITKDTDSVCYWQNNKYKILKETHTDSTGNYEFSNIVANNYNVIAIYEMPESKKYGGSGLRSDIDSAITVISSVNKAKTIFLLVTCPYEKTKNQLFCPKCKQKDKVKEIIFGFAFNTKDGKHNYDNYYLGGCDVDLYCNPTRHCLRCNLDF